MVGLKGVVIPPLFLNGITTIDIKMAKNENIRTLWYRMLKETQATLLSIAMVEFKLTSSTFIKQTWMQKGEVPEEHEGRLVDIMQKLLVQQEAKTKQLIGQ